VLRIAFRAVVALLLLLPLFGTPTLAQETLSPRLQIGIGMLPAVVAANQRLANNDGQAVTIYLVYRINNHVAGQLKAALAKIDRIRNHEVRVEPISIADLLATELEPTSAIFLAEPLDDEFADLVEFAQRERVLLFSPFEGDVKRGAMTGFRVTDKVLPMVNMTSLKQSNIYMKAFFLRIAVKHE